jgi:hypothetical protein
VIPGLADFPNTQDDNFLLLLVNDLMASGESALREQHRSRDARQGNPSQTPPGMERRRPIDATTKQLPQQHSADSMERNRHTQIQLDAVLFAQVTLEASGLIERLGHVFRPYNGNRLSFHSYTGVFQCAKGSNEEVRAYFISLLRWNGHRPIHEPAVF